MSDAAMIAVMNKITDHLSEIQVMLCQIDLQLEDLVKTLREQSED